MLYTGMGWITLKCLVLRDISVADDFGIRYEKPDGTTGVIDIDAGATLHENGKAIVYDVNTDSFLDQSGLWKFQSFAKFGAVTALGDVAKIKVHESISLS